MFAFVRAHSSIYDLVFLVLIVCPSYAIRRSSLLVFIMFAWDVTQSLLTSVARYL